MCDCCCNCYKRYGILNFVGDVFMIFITLGFWLVWIFVREMRRR